MKRISLILLFLIVLCVSFTGCNIEKDNYNIEVPISTPKNNDNKQQNNSIVNLVDFDLETSKRDNDSSFNTEESTKVNFSLDSVVINGKGATSTESSVTIKEEGTYIISGNSLDGQIYVKSGETDKIQIVLNGISLTSKTSPIVIESADKVFITIADGTTNLLTDCSDYALNIGDSAVDAAIFSKADLTINGTGTLNIEGRYKHGIVSKDDLVITSGNITVKSNSTALEGKDCVKIAGGYISLNSGTNGIRSTNTTDSTRGFVSISAGTVNINSKKDGIQAASIINISDGKIDINSNKDAIHADSILKIDGGSISINKCNEGLEASNIVINNGTIRIKSDDDGINASSGKTSSSARPGRGEASDNSLLEINGGYIVIDASGDGIDSNGNVVITGGVTLVSGSTRDPEVAFDYNGIATISGGYFMAVGVYNNMTQTFSNTSSQGTILVNFSRTENAISLCDADRKVLISFTPPKPYNCVLISTPEIEKGSTYNICSGVVDNINSDGYATGSSIRNATTLAEVTMESIHYGENKGGFNGPGGKPKR